MICLIKSENILSRFYIDIYTIKYQKRGFPHMRFIIILDLADEFLKVFYTNKIIYIKLLIIKINPINKFIKIMTLVIFHDLCREINLHLVSITNAQDDF